MEPIIDHIEITVRDMSLAVPFYDKLLPLLGFDVRSRGSATLEKHEKYESGMSIHVWALPSPRQEENLWVTRSIGGNQGRSIILHSRQHLALKWIDYILN